VARVADPRWVDAGWGICCGSIDVLLGAISRIGTFELGRRYVWRGARDSRWSIRTSLQRHMLEHRGDRNSLDEADVRLTEREIIRAARQWRLDDAGRLPDQAVLARLQHHGLPTRLLDVTSDPMTALWFATEPTPDGGRGTSGALFAFDVTGLPRFHTGPAMNRTTWGSFESPSAWDLAHRELGSQLETRPVLLEPSERDARMSAQNALFIFGATPASPSIAGLDAFPLDPGSPPGEDQLRAALTNGPRRRGRPAKLPFVALIVPAMIKKRLRTHLETTYSKARRDLFPDISGFADAVRGQAVTWPDVGEDVSLT